MVLCRASYPRLDKVPVVLRWFATSREVAMRLLAYGFLWFLFAAGSLSAQGAAAGNPSAADSDETIARIVGHSLTSSGAMEFLETLTDTIGGRITGRHGTHVTDALDLTAQRDAGFVNAQI